MDAGGAQVGCVWQWWPSSATTFCLSRGYRLSTIALRKDSYNPLVGRICSHPKIAAGKMAAAIFLTRWEKRTGAKRILCSFSIAAAILKFRWERSGEPRLVTTDPTRTNEFLHFRLSSGENSSMRVWIGATILEWFTYKEEGFFPIGNKSCDHIEFKWAAPWLTYPTNGGTRRVTTAKGVWIIEKTSRGNCMVLLRITLHELCPNNHIWSYMPGQPVS